MTSFSSHGISFFKVHLHSPCNVFIPGAALGLLVLGLIFHATGLRVNVTRSIPIGLYHVTDAPVEKGEYVIFCPPESTLFDEAREHGYIGAGFCQGGYGLWLRRYRRNTGKG